MDERTVDAPPVGCPRCGTILTAATAGCLDPWHYDNHAPTPAQQREAVALLSRLAVIAVDMAVLDAGPEYDRATGAERTRYIVHSTLAYLVGHGLIEATAAARSDDPLPVTVPEHLRAALDSRGRNNRRG